MDNQLETATPYYLSTWLETYGITVEFAPAGMQDTQVYFPCQYCKEPFSDQCKKWQMADDWCGNADSRWFFFRNESICLRKAKPETVAWQILHFQSGKGNHVSFDEKQERLSILNMPYHLFQLNRRKIILIMRYRNGRSKIWRLGQRRPGPRHWAGSRLKEERKLSDGLFTLRSTAVMRGWSMSPKATGITATMMEDPWLPTGDFLCRRLDLGYIPGASPLRAILEPEKEADMIQVVCQDVWTEWLDCRPFPILWAIIHAWMVFIQRVNDPWCIQERNSEFDIEKASLKGWRRMLLRQPCCHGAMVRPALSTPFIIRMAGLTCVATQRKGSC